MVDPKDFAANKTSLEHEQGLLFTELFISMYVPTHLAKPTTANPTPINFSVANLENTVKEVHAPTCYLVAIGVPGAWATSVFRCCHLVYAREIEWVYTFFHG